MTAPLAPDHRDSVDVSDLPGGKAEALREEARLQYFLELLNIVNTLGNQKKSSTTLSEGVEYWREQMESCDLVWLDEERGLELYLGTLDAAVNTDLLLNCDFERIQGDGFNGGGGETEAVEYNLEKILEAVHKTVKNSKHVVPPPPTDAEITARKAAQGSGEKEYEKKEKEEEEKLAALEKIERADLPSAKSGNDATSRANTAHCQQRLSPPLPRLFAGLINCCGYDKRFIKMNRNFSVQHTHLYVEHTTKFYQQEWNRLVLGAECNKDGEKKGSANSGTIPSGLAHLKNHIPLKQMPYLQFNAVDNENYDIAKHFMKVNEFINGTLESVNGSLGAEAGTSVATPFQFVQPKRRSQGRMNASQKQAEFADSPRGSDSGPGGPFLAAASFPQSREPSKPKFCSAFLIHCVVGSNRSACCTCAFLMRYCRWTAKEAISVVAWKRRYRILTNRAFLSALIDYESLLREEGLLTSR